MRDANLVVALKLKLIQVAPLRSISDRFFLNGISLSKNVSVEIAEAHGTFTILYYYYSAWVGEEMNKFLMYFGTLWIVQILSIVK